MIIRTLSLALAVVALSGVKAADTSAPAPQSAPPAAPETAPRSPNPPAAAPATGAQDTTVDGLSPRIDTWFQGTLVTLDTEHSTFTVHGGTMPYASAYAKMLRSAHEKTVNLSDSDQRHRIEADIHEAWQERLNQARAEPPNPASSDMHFQLPARGTVMMLNEDDSGGLGFLNFDRGMKERASNVDAGKPAAISSLRDFKPGDRVMVGYASDSPERDLPEAFAIVRERPGTIPSAEHQAYPPTTTQTQPVEETRTTTVFEERPARDTLSNAGHTMKSGLEKGANKIKHFFGGGD